MTPTRKTALWCLGGLIPALAIPAWATPAADGNAQTGAQVYRSRCLACHATSAGPPAKPGPILRGVSGRAAGAVPGFAYSPAMARTKFVWTDERLRAFLADPSRTVPGTKMTSGAIRDPAALNDVLAYLKSLR